MKSTFFLFLMITTISVTAQIEFTDIPDTTLNETNLALDLNNDGEVDFALYYISEGGVPGSGYYMNAYCVVPYNNNEVLALGYGQTVSKYKSDTISVSDSDWMPFFENPSYFITRESSNEDLNLRNDGFEDLFVGLRLQDQGDYYYAWAQLSSEGASNLTLKTYACNTVLNELIVIDDSFFLERESMLARESCRIYPNPANSRFTVSVDDEGTSHLEIYDITGKSVLETEFVGKLSVNSETLKEGLYIISVQTKEEKIVRKILID